MGHIRSDVIILPPNTAVKRLNSMRNATTGVATSTSIWTYPAVSIVSSTDATPIVLTVGTGHGFLAGDIVTVASHLTNTHANGTWTLGTVGATTLQLLGTTGTGGGSGGATGTVNFPSAGKIGCVEPETKCWVTFEAITYDVYVRMGAAATAGTTTANGLVIPAGTAASFYLTPSIHVNVDHYSPGGAGTLKWYVSSPPCERERI